MVIQSELNFVIFEVFRL